MLKRDSFKNFFTSYSWLLHFKTEKKCIDSPNIP